MFTSILSSIIIWSAVLIIALRVVTNSGIQFSNNKYISELTCYKGTSSNYETTKKDILCVFLLAFSFSDNINSFGDILEQYMKWDANNYVRIATGGYTYYTEGENFTTLAFFPLYPWLMRIVNIIFRDLRVSGLLTSFALYSGACCFLYKLFSIDYSKSVAVRAIIYMSVFPHALFFCVLMNESMLLFTSATTLYYIRKH